MKVISKPSLPLQTCVGCTSVVKLKYKDLKTDGISLRRIIWSCPVCQARNVVSFVVDKKEEEKH